MDAVVAAYTLTEIDAAARALGIRPASLAIGLLQGDLDAADSLQSLTGVHPEGFADLLESA